MSKQHLIKKKKKNTSVIKYSTVYRWYTIMAPDGAVTDYNNEYKMFIMGFKIAGKKNNLQGICKAKTTQNKTKTKKKPPTLKVLPTSWFIINKNNEHYIWASTPL